MRIRRGKIAQSLLEYTLLFAVLGAALSAMSLYSRRAIQAGIKVAADELGEQRKGGLEYDFVVYDKNNLAGSTCETGLFSRIYAPQ